MSVTTCASAGRSSGRALRIEIQELGGGYRPTCTGMIGERPFVLRVHDGSWVFMVGHPAATDLWWHSPPDEVDYEARGACEAMFHDALLPLLLAQLRGYLTHLAVDEATVATLLHQAELEAAKHS